MRNILSGKQNTVRRKMSDSRGMTMGEMMVVVAIVCILFGVAFISVMSHQRSLAQTERDTIAKEIFVAAQNHLSMAKGEGYLDVRKFGYDGTLADIDDDGVYYYAVNGGLTTPGADETSVDATDIFAQMLPFGAIDENVRGGGDYIIRYQPKTGIVLDVFYCSKTGSKFGYNLAANAKAEYAKLMSSDYYGEANKGARKEYGTDKAIVGWYGGAQAEELGEISLKAPRLEVVNAETLYVKVTDMNKLVSEDYGIRLFISGRTSKKEHYIEILKSDKTKGPDVLDGGAIGTYEFVLDDITKEAGDHFANKKFYALEVADTAGKDPNVNDFIPGEDIALQAVVYTNEYLSNVARSEQKVTNSLFEGIEDKTGNDIPDVAYIGNIRHLENLDLTVSKLDKNDEETFENKEGELCLKQAIQTDNLDWDGFLDIISEQNGIEKDAISISYGQGLENSSDGTEGGCYKPIDFDGKNLYDGKGHSIKNIKVDVKHEIGSGSAGLFSSADRGTLKNLELIDFNIKSEGGNAGALVGTLGGATVVNVVAHNSEDTGITDISGTNAGGLIGDMIGGTTMYSAASLIVTGVETAGGLTGKAEASESGSNSSIKWCYSGGHTKDGLYKDWIKETNHGYDVTATADTSAAGGLVGNAGDTEIADSYSTCSVSGKDKAGGFVGSANVREIDSAHKKNISNCYCTGLIDTAKLPEASTNSSTNPNENKGAFAGALGSTLNLDSCSCLEIINAVYREGKAGEADTFERYLYAVGDKEDTPRGIQQIDSNTNSYDAFVKGPTTWNPAEVYDNGLRIFYNVNNKAKYPFRTVDQISGTDKNKTTVTISDYNQDYHKFVVTHYGDWPAPETFIINE